MVGRASPTPNRLNLDSDMRLKTQGLPKDGISNCARYSKTTEVFHLLWQFSLQDGTTLLSELHCLKIRQYSFVGQYLFHKFHISRHLLKCIGKQNVYVEFLDTSKNLVNCLSNLLFFQALRVWDRDSRFSHVWPTLSLCFFFTQLFRMGLFPYYLVSLARLDYFFCLYLRYH